MTNVDSQTPVITATRVVPVAGHDSMLLNLAGAHGPHFIRILVLLTSSEGRVGAGEIPGCEATLRGLVESTQLVLGTALGDFQNTLNTIRRLVCGQTISQYRPYTSIETDPLQPHWASLRLENVITAVEAALLDLLGQHMGVPLCQLLGNGQQRTTVPINACLFYIGDSTWTTLSYARHAARDDWYGARQRVTLTPTALADQADAAANRYGFKHFKLNGGVMSPEQEMAALAVIGRRHPSASLAVDPNGAWSCVAAIELCNEYGTLLSYVEDPCGAEQGYSGREIMAEFRRATGVRTATHLMSTDWRQMANAHRSGAVDIPLTDPHFWTLTGSVRLAQWCNDIGATWGSHSNSHFDISLAMFTHVAAAAPGAINAIDTHWIWQECSERLTRAPLQIKNGEISVPDRPGLGVELDMEQIERAHQLYKQVGLRTRDDAIAMKYLVPKWKYDAKRPSMSR